ncbi:monofunctional biosynthetic peptidoglycan transglycosylase [uncultured Bacteroides sp.]|jgi:monofunctional biosynthetic peptidoglycan transglycosylase|uniref:monofunctional biosynthetic peptidoglycan transglycosylase n=1 Tax=Bacteroides ilei TaxID=1907658 RepID=UPI00280BEE29|nr:monofunctional biosynthetic peptidoglycan transglycosylase [uncultured Bacteroides sp.]
MNVKNIFKYLRYLLIAFFGSTILSVIVLKFVPVYVTPLMIIRCGQQISQGEKLKMKHHWVPKEKISRHLPMAVIASEDNRFAEHWGFDFIEIRKAVKENKTRKKARGASTISQQTAKNVFLWPQSSWVRKGLEVYFTLLIECFWSKERIMEVYLNSIEMGNGIYGAQAVAEEHFGTSAKKLTRSQCALIAASLPNPIRFNSGKPSAYMYKRQKQIMRLMRLVPAFPPKDKDLSDR